MMIANGLMTMTMTSDIIQKKITAYDDLSVTVSDAPLATGLDHFIRKRLFSLKLKRCSLVTGLAICC